MHVAATFGWTKTIWVNWFFCQKHSCVIWVINETGKEKAQKPCQKMLCWTAEKNKSFLDVVCPNKWKGCHHRNSDNGILGKTLWQVIGQWAKPWNCMSCNGNSSMHKLLKEQQLFLFCTIWTQHSNVFGTWASAEILATLHKCPEHMSEAQKNHWVMWMVWVGTQAPHSKIHIQTQLDP